jgi:hypothetical protein
MPKRDSSTASLHSNNGEGTFDEQSKRRRTSAFSTDARENLEHQLGPIDENKEAPPMQLVNALPKNIGAYKPCLDDNGTVTSNTLSVCSMPATTTLVEHELKKLCKVGNEDILEPSTTVEARMLESFNNPNYKPNENEILGAIAANPFSSFLLQLGRTSLAMNTSVLLTKASRAQHLAEEHKRLGQECYDSERKHQDALVEAQARLREAQMSVNALELTYSSIKANRVEHETQVNLLTREHKVCSALEKLGSLFQKEFLPLRDVPVAQVRKMLHLQSPDACKLSRPAVLCILRVLDLAGYELNQEFRRFWAVPPKEYEGDVAQWEEDYGRYVQIKTGKDNLTTLQKRLANYLGMAEPSTLPDLNENMTGSEEDKVLEFILKKRGLSLAALANRLGIETGEEAEE